MRRIGVVMVAVLAAGALAGCRGGSADPSPGQARLIERSGTVEVSTDDRTWHAASAGTVETGARVRVRHGRAVLALPHDGRVELRDRSQIRVGRFLRLLAGDLLVRAGDAVVPVDAASAVASVTAGGDARLARGLTFDAAVYDGAVDLRSGGRRFRVAALRQASVPGLGLLPARALPLQYRATDAWDREFLAEWMALGNDLDARSRGLTGQVGGDQGRTAGFYRLLLPALDDERAFTQDLVDAYETATPGEKLVGAAIAVSSTRGGNFARRWNQVFSFREDGAAWGLVALDQRIHDRPRLVTEIDQALSRVVTRPDVAAAATATPTEPTSRSGPDSSTTPGTSASPTTSSPPRSSPTTVPPTTAPPFVPILPLPSVPAPAPAPPSNQAQPSEPQPDDGTIGQLTDQLVSTVGGLLGGLTPPSP